MAWTKKSPVCPILIYSFLPYCPHLPPLDPQLTHPSSTHALEMRATLELMTSKKTGLKESPPPPPTNRSIGRPVSQWVPLEASQTKCQRLPGQGLDWRSQTSVQHLQQSGHQVAVGESFDSSSSPTLCSQLLLPPRWFSPECQWCRGWTEGRSGGRKRRGLGRNAIKSLWEASVLVSLLTRSDHINTITRTEQDRAEGEHIYYMTQIE